MHLCPHVLCACWPNESSNVVWHWKVQQVVTGYAKSNVSLRMCSQLSISNGQSCRRGLQKSHSHSLTDEARRISSSSVTDEAGNVFCPDRRGWTLICSWPTRPNILINFVPTPWPTKCWHFYCYSVVFIYTWRPLYSRLEETTINHSLIGGLLWPNVTDVINRRPHEATGTKDSTIRSPAY